MGDWQAFADKTRTLLNSKNFTEAREEVEAGLEKVPNQVNLLTIATDVYRALGDREKSLKYAELLITHHPDNWNGYGRAAQDLSLLKRFEEAQTKVQSGLEKFPNQVNLLTIATYVYRASGDREKSLEYAELLITHHPDNWKGHGRAAQNLSLLKRFEEAQTKVQAGLKKFPNQVNLLTIATDVYRASGDREKSLEYAELLITHHPDNWNGYGSAAQDLVALKRFKDAQEKAHEGLEKFPNQFNLLTIANNVYRATDDREQSLKYAKLLITHHPDNPHGYIRSTQDLVALKRFEAAQKQIQTGLEKIPNQVILKKYLAYANSFLGVMNQSMSDSEKDSISLNIDDLISYSSVPGFFKIIQSRRNARPEDTKAHSKYVFVAGIGRSGTTALGELLNISSLIAMYTELHLPFRVNGYSRLDFSEKEVSARLKSQLEYSKQNFPIPLKSISAKLIGDKRPGFQFCAESTFDNLGIDNIKCIFIDRSLVDICRSSHRRSENSNDLFWTIERGVEYAILVYNASCRQIIHLHDNRPDIFSSFLFPTYEDVFSSTEKVLELMNFCGVELSAEETGDVDVFIRNSQKYVSNKVDPSDPLDIHIRKSISKLLDHDVHERFCIVTGNNRKYLVN
jgi:tetratricopeptide (TPR) repeat protein